MFKNIGSKIKKLSKFIAICGIIISIFIGIIIFTDENGDYIRGAIIVGLGILFSWIGAFVLYGFGELVEYSSIIASQYKGNNIGSQKNNTTLLDGSGKFSSIDNNVNIPKEHEWHWCFYKLIKLICIF